jgi:hypothetical protein
MCGRDAQTLGLALVLAMAQGAFPASASGLGLVEAREAPVPARPVQALVAEYCLDCHDAELKKGGLNLEGVEDILSHGEIWETVIRRLRAGQMPPAGKRRPGEGELAGALAQLESTLDRAAEQNPNPGRTQTFRRLNRAEYQNVIRDLLGVEIDAAGLLPKDESGHGFDNIAAGDLSPMLLDRYISAARKISRLAMGSDLRAGGDTFRLPADLTQEKRVEGLPVGTRGGALIRYTFPRDGEYDFQVRLTRDRNEAVEGLHAEHELELLVDGECVKRFTVVPPRGPYKDFDAVDAHLKARVAVKAGVREMGVTFVQQSAALVETLRQPYQARFNYHRHPRLAPAIYQISINGPYDSTGPGNTTSRQRILTRLPESKEAEESCAQERLSSLLRRAYRREVSDADLEGPMRFFRDARAFGGFEAGMESALSAILVSPEFLFRIERDPPGTPSGMAYRISDTELASRLSFFLWSSIPDEELLELAIRNELRRPEVLERQVLRMLADPRADALAEHFAGQWLHLRNLDSVTPDQRLFPDFDENLRRAFRRETEMFFSRMIREDRSALDLLRSDYTYLNERLARHYGIPHVMGSRFRKVALRPDSHRGGLLRQGSILTVTSYATRTSPVLRGKWILENILGTPPPPPLPDVPALMDNTVSARLSVRERLAQHRNNPACASCHDVLDPPGFALEHYDAVGRWRALEEGVPVDSSGGLPDGSVFSGVAGLEEGLLRRPDVFVGTLSEKLLTYALGRGIEPWDAPAIRKIVRQAREQDYRFSSIIVGIANSTPFLMRRAL